MDPSEIARAAAYVAALDVERTVTDPDEIRDALWIAIRRIAPEAIADPKGRRTAEAYVDTYAHVIAARLRAMIEG